MISCYVILVAEAAAGPRGVPPSGDILAIFYPPLKSIWGCVWLCLQAREGNIYFAELAERVEYGNYDSRAS